MSYNITVEGGKSVRLPTKGKYCDRDIVVTATGGKEPVIEPLEVTENGVYRPPLGEMSFDGYSPVTVNVPIPDGYIQPSGTKEITENGTHDVTEYAEVNVNVPSREPVLQEKTVTENGEVTPDDGYDGLSKVTVNVPTGGGGGALELFVTQGILSDSGLTEISGNNIFRGMYNLKKLDLPNVTKVGTYMCYGCTNLEEVNMPNCTTLGTYAFYNNTSLKRIDFPKLISAPATAFRQCTSATAVNLPVCTTLNSYAFQGCTALEKIDLPKVDWLGAQVFNGCTALATLIFRANEVCTMSNANNIFGSSPIAKGTGYIYVPDNLVDSYKAASNWSKYAAQIKPISELG